MQSPPLSYQTRGYKCGLLTFRICENAAEFHFPLLETQLQSIRECVEEAEYWQQYEFT